MIKVEQKFLDAKSKEEFKALNPSSEANILLGWSQEQLEPYLELLSVMTAKRIKSEGVEIELEEGGEDKYPAYYNQAHLMQEIAEKIPQEVLLMMAMSKIEDTVKQIIQSDPMAAFLRLFAKD